MDCEALFELIRTRRSIRRFSPRCPDRAQLERLFEAACWAPSNHNRQGWKFIVLQDGDVIRDLADRVRQSMRRQIAAAPRLARDRADELVATAGAFDTAPLVILAMHKRPVAVGRSMLAAATSEHASGEMLSVAMAVQNLLLAAHALGLGACVMTAPLLAGEVWSQLPDLPAGFEPTCLVTLGYPAEQPAAPRRKGLQHVVEYRP